MKLIVTGGAGFIGSNFIYYQLENHPEDEILCLDKLTYAGNLETLENALQNPKFKFFRTDISDRAAVYELFEKEHPDIVVNFAAESHVDRSIENPSFFYKPMSWGHRFCSTPAECMASGGFIRYLRMKSTEIFP
jgi:dTDP-glucose 4,6-dehydratase